MNGQIGTLKELDVEPGDVVEWIAARRTYTVDEDGILRHDDGGFIRPTAMAIFRLISRATPEPSIDLTAITTPFGLLDKATQDALIAHGGPYQRFWHDGWKDFQPDVNPSWSPVGVYRTTPPGPKRETVTKTAWVANDGSVDLRGPDNCTITYDLVDDEIDMETYKVTKK